MYKLTERRDGKVATGCSVADRPISDNMGNATR